MAHQLTFDLPVRAALDRGDFFVSASNAAAVAILDSWQDWPTRKMVLCGPKGAGKTHLARVWAQDAGAQVLGCDALSIEKVRQCLDCDALVIEDIQVAAGNKEMETALFHLFNMAHENGVWLLLSANQPPGRLNFVLPDIASRLQGVGLALLEPPDDRLLSALLVKLFTDRQISVTPHVIMYLVGRMERSFEAAQDLVAALDRRALQEKRAISKPLAGQVLDNLAAGKA